MLTTVYSLHKYAKISPSKLRIIAPLIRRKNAINSLEFLKFDNRKSSFLISKVLKSAISNAENNFSMDTSKLVVRELLIDEGPIAKRFRARARGRGARVIKRTSHIKIILGE